MKKVFMIVLSVLVVLSLSLTSFAAPNVADPVVSFGFNEDEGITIVGGALATDDERGSVLTLNGGKKNESYAAIESDVYANTNWDDGMTIAFWVKAENADSGIAPLYSFNIADNGCEGYIATTDSLEIAINTDGNSGMALYPRVWADPSVIDATAQPTLEAGKWQHVAVAVSASGMTIYLNGEIYANPVLGPSSANFKMFLEQIQYIYGLQFGNWNCGWWDDIGAFAGSFDDVYVFNTALSQSEVKNIMTAEFDTVTDSDSLPVVPVIIGIVVVAVMVVIMVLVWKKHRMRKNSEGNV